MLIDLIDKDDEELASKYTYVIKKGGAVFAEVHATGLYGFKGAYLWGAASPIFDLDGRIIGGIESIRDISERKHAEKIRSAIYQISEAGSSSKEFR